jgi:hypothetical protein
MSDVHVTFYSGEVLMESESEKAGRPIFRDQEMVKIMWPGDRTRELHAPAHDKFQLEKNSGYHKTYAQVFAEQYKKFSEGAADQTVGTPLRFLPFMTGSKVQELAHFRITTAEQLSQLPDRVLEKLGPGGHTMRDQARVWLGDAEKTAVVAEANNRVAALEARLAAMEKAAKGDPFDDMDDETLRSWLIEHDASPRANASRKNMIAAARDIASVAA